jgi:hypothetical protein
MQRWQPTAGSEAVGRCAHAELAMSERKKTVAVTRCIWISDLGECDCELASLPTPSIASRSHLDLTCGG